VRILDALIEGLTIHRALDVDDEYSADAEQGVHRILAQAGS
jgi:hypothetical protein